MSRQLSLSGSEMAETTTIAVVGLGHVGLVSAACLAALGHRVAGVDRDSSAVRRIMTGKAPFIERGLDEEIARGLNSGRLCVGTDITAALDAAEVVMLCVGTPQDPHRGSNTDELAAAAHQVAASLAQMHRSVTIVVRSTTPPGVCRAVVVKAFRDLPGLRVVSNPEFLREGSAVRDFMRPPLLVVGSDDQAAAVAVSKIYSGLPVTPSIVPLESAELIKHACNAFHAAKIAFANEIGSIAAGLGVSGEQVMDVLCSDEQLNISPKYLKPGFAFGGSCLSKDVQALTYLAARLGLQLPVLGSVLSSNEAHLQRATAALQCRPESRIGFVGLSFKEGTDDIRNSPALVLVRTAIAAGRQVRVFDQGIRSSPDRAMLEQALSGAGLTGGEWTESLDELTGWAELIVITHTSDAPSAAAIAATGKPILDFSSRGFGSGSQRHNSRGGIESRAWPESNCRISTTPVE